MILNIYDMFNFNITLPLKNVCINRSIQKADGSDTFGKERIGKLLRKHMVCFDLNAGASLGVRNPLLIFHCLNGKC